MPHCIGQAGEWLATNCNSKDYRMSKNSKAKRDAKKKKLRKKNTPSKNNVIHFLTKERKQYLKEWEHGNAKLFKADGHYEWMANFVKGYTKILEIGTGDGRGTLQLVKNGHKIISIDENKFCLDAAQKRLEKNNVSVHRLKREIVRPIGEGSHYSIKYKTIQSQLPECDVLLIEGDINNDDTLLRWLEKNKLFDAVICWLIGTHGGRGFNEIIDINVIPTPMHYRLKVQNRVYEVSDLILRTKGILHIVDRGQMPNTKELLDGLRDGHKDQASVTSLEVKDLNFRQYEEPTNGNSVEMCMTITEHTECTDTDNLTLQSIVSVKP